MWTLYGGHSFGTFQKMLDFSLLPFTVSRLAIPMQFGSFVGRMVFFPSLHCKEPLHVIIAPTKIFSKVIRVVLCNRNEIHSIFLSLEFLVALLLSHEGNLATSLEGPPAG